MKKMIPIILFIGLLCPLLSYGQFSSFANTYGRYKHAKDEGKNVNSWLRYEVGYSLPIANATYFHNVETTDEYGNVYDTSASKKIHATSSFGMYAGTFFKVDEIDENSILAISLGARCNFYKWSTGDFQVTSSVTDNYDFLSIDMGLPVSLDYKYGSDATLNKSQRSCYTFGVGGYPAIVFTGVPEGINADGSIAVAGKGGLVVQPFVKAEFGFFAGICWKLRAMYNFGTIKYLNMGNSDGSGEQISLNGKSNLTLSLILMPFSWDWERKW